MEDSSVFIIEILVVGDDLQKQPVVQRQISRRGQQPTVAELALLHVESRIPFHEKLRIVTYFL